MSVPKPACPMISNVVRLSHSKISKDLVLRLDSFISFCQSLESRSDFCQNTGVRARIEEIEKPGARALR